MVPLLFHITGFDIGMLKKKVYVK
uniref:Uncharacterized protein n=1 Tax=Lotus japonicus TaxID=34305 RepID=I3SKJ4_LOTJA|nr:unknown [Lotus japonicus]